MSRGRAVAAALLLGGLLSSCSVLSRHYAYQPPMEFNGHPWGQRIEEFNGLELMFSCRISAVSCAVPIPAEISAYTQRPETFSLPGVHLTSVLYLFCYEGIATQLCGSEFDFESEEFELAPHRVGPDGLTNYERIRRELFDRYGPPHRGKLTSPRIRVFENDGTFIPSENLEGQRYSWCGLNDPHAPAVCPVTVILTWSPLLGHGTVLYATPQLHRLAAQYQKGDRFPFKLYESLFEYAKPSQMPVQVGCSGEVAAQVKSPFQFMKRFDADRLYSERTLDSAAYSQHELRAEPRHQVMDEDLYEHQHFAEQQMDRYRKDWRRIAYWWGYVTGLSWAYDDGRLESKEAHEKWLDSIHASHQFVQEFGRGYGNGLKLYPDPPEALHAPSDRDAEEEALQIQHLRALQASRSKAPEAPAASPADPKQDANPEPPVPNSPLVH